MSWWIGIPGLPSTATIRSAFFTEGKPVAGSDDYELRYGGVVWRFANLGNRAAFAASPDVYMPQYGGYDPIGIARGIAVAGNPNVWLIVGEKLFLFYSDDRREKFAADPNRVTGSADRQWPAVSRSAYAVIAWPQAIKAGIKSPSVP